MLSVDRQPLRMESDGNPYRANKLFERRALSLKLLYVRQKADYLLQVDLVQRFP